MKCKCCKNEIPNGSLYCMYCGEKLFKTKAEAKRPNVPKPRQQKSGEWIGQLMILGQRFTVKGATLEEYYDKAMAFKNGFLEVEKTPKCTLRQALRRYIDNNENVLSPSTVRAYEAILKSRFKHYMDRPIDKINFQAMVSDEAPVYSPKTVSNSWTVVASALKSIGFTPPNVNLPRIPPSDKPFLDYEQIKVFLDAIKGNKAELAAILALHSLRISEIIDLDVSQIGGGYIHVSGATVRDKNNKLVHKDSNKTSASTRDVPVIIDRLYDLLPDSGKLITCSYRIILYQTKKVCEKAGLPICGVHDLRRSFASLAYHLKWNSQTTQQIGGWSNLSTVENVYRKLSLKEKNDDVERMREFFNTP